jgi:hypothetical protein
MSGAKPGAQEVTGEHARSHDAAVAVFQRPNEEQAGRKEMSLRLFIPDSVTQAIRLPEKQMEETFGRTRHHFMCPGSPVIRQGQGIGRYVKI